MNRTLGPGVRLRYRRRDGSYLLVEQEPHIQRYFYGGDIYLLPMPWLYYGLAYAAEFAGDPHPNHMLIVNLVAAPYRAETFRAPLAWLPLPNMYGTRPCYHYHGRLDHPDQASEVQAAITSWWDEVGNKDGHLADNVTWRHIALMGGHATGHRKKVLATWERLSAAQVQALPWPKVCSYRTLTHGWHG